MLAAPAGSRNPRLRKRAFRAHEAPAFMQPNPGLAIAEWRRRAFAFMLAR